MMNTREFKNNRKHNKKLLRRTIRLTKIDRGRKLTTEEMANLCKGFKNGISML